MRDWVGPGGRGILDGAVKRQESNAGMRKCGEGAGGQGGQGCSRGCHACMHAGQAICVPASHLCACVRVRVCAWVCACVRVCEHPCTPPHPPRPPPHSTCHPTPPRPTAPTPPHPARTMQRLHRMPCFFRGMTTATTDTGRGISPGIAQPKCRSVQHRMQNSKLISLAITQASSAMCDAGCKTLLV